MNINSNSIQMWEILKDGKDGQVFEVVQCNLSDFVGRQVKVKEKTTYGKKAKCLVKPDSTGDSEANLVTLHGHLVTAKFKMISTFKEISLSHAVTLMEENDEAVYISDGSAKRIWSKYDDFEDDLNIVDFDDLVSKKFYIRES